MTGRVVTNVLLTIVALGMIAPMAWMVVTSLRANPEQYGTLSEILGAATTFDNYADAWRSDNFLRYFLNSLLVATVVTAGNILFCLWAGYAFARRRFKGGLCFSQPS
ncbi:MAG: carbohydrate ABC transporter permease [Ignavibacteria bacterium]|nr:carbohydrate ABC transporter permease [Ignavibacteria bacterium]